MAKFFNRSVLKPEGSIMAGVAVAGTVYAVYSMHAGSVAQAQVTDANNPALEAARKKAGYISFILVSGLTLITRDGNVGTLGYGSIIAMEMAYRHAIMAHPATGKMTQPTPDPYRPAESSNVVPMVATTTADDGTAGYGA